MIAAAHAPDYGGPHPPDRAGYLAVAVAVPLILALFGFGLNHEYQRAEMLRLEARDAFNQRLLLGDLAAGLARAQASERGFVLTGDRDFLAPFVPARVASFATLDRLAENTAGDPAQLAHLRTLRRLVALSYDRMQRVVDRRAQAGLAAAIKELRLGWGTVLSDGLTAHIRALRHLEVVSSDRRLTLFLQRSQLTRRIVWLTAGLTSGLLLLSLWLLWRQRCERYVAERQGHDAATRNRAVLDSTFDAIAILNANGIVESVNAAFTRLLGYAPDELVGRNASLLFLPDRGKASLADRIGLSDGRIGKPYLPDRALRHFEGHPIPVDIALGLMRLPDGDHVVASIRDISERRRTEQMKDELMATVSHELRTPLTSVVGALGLLRAGSAGELPAPARRLTEIAETNSRRLIRLINDMLDIDRIQSGHLQISRDPIDLRTVVAQACEGSEGLARSKDVRIVAATGNEPVRVDGDSERLVQVIANLASNAIRVSPPAATVTIAAALSEGGRAIVTVDDEGPGVPREFRGRIFGRFERAAGEQGVGTGLGLAISREIVLRHAGHIWFEDRPGGGTRFAFSLGARRDEPDGNRPAAAASRLRAARSGSERPTILHLDDDADMLDVTASLLEPDARVLKAPSLAIARQLVETERPDVAILDLSLGDGSGLELLPMLVDRAGLAIPTIIYSAHDVSSATAARVDAVLVKSRRSLPDLQATIRRIVRGRAAAEP